MTSEPILSVQGRTNPEPTLLIRSDTVWLWFLLIRLACMHLFTFWSSTTDPESKKPAGIVAMKNIYEYLSQKPLCKNSKPTGHIT